MPLLQAPLSNAELGDQSALIAVLFFPALAVVLVAVVGVADLVRWHRRRTSQGADRG